VIPPDKGFLKSFFGITMEVPSDRKLTQLEIAKLLELTPADVPGAAVFARKDDGSLRTPAEQLAAFKMRTTPAPAKLLKLYCNSRGGLVQQSMKVGDMHAAVRQYMELEASDGKFRIADPEDGKFENQRHQTLVLQWGSNQVKRPWAGALCGQGCRR